MGAIKSRGFFGVTRFKSIEISLLSKYQTAFIIPDGISNWIIRRKCILYIFIFQRWKRNFLTDNRGSVFLNEANFVTAATYHVPVHQSNKKFYEDFFSLLGSLSFFFIKFRVFFMHFYLLFFARWNNVKARKAKIIFTLFFLSSIKPLKYYVREDWLTFM